MRPFIVLLALTSFHGVAGAQKIQTIAGRGRPGYGGDGGQATAALLNQPFHCDLYESHLYVADALNHCIRKVDLRSGIIETVAGCGKRGYSGDGGPAIEAKLNEPYAVAVDLKGDLYIVDRLNAVIRKVEKRTGTITTVAGNGKRAYGGDGGPGPRAGMVEPNDCCLDGSGGLLIADVGDWRIRRLDLRSGRIATFAGTGKPKTKTGKLQKGDGGPAARAVIVGARAVCVDGKAATFICEREGNVIRRVDAGGRIQTLAGTGATGYTGDGGDARKATFRGPKGIRCDRAGNVFVVDTENHAIRKIDVKTGAVSTVAGGRKGSGGDGGKAVDAELNRPHGCVIDARGCLYIADSENHRVRKVNAP
jgi:sugar lactone lactonase YvrE